MARAKEATANGSICDFFRDEGEGNEGYEGEGEGEGDECGEGEDDEGDAGDDGGEGRITR